MNHQRSSAIAKKRVAAGSISKDDIVVSHFQLGVAFCAHSKVRHVAGVVSVGIFETMLLPIRIEVRACGFEVGAIALGGLMKMDCVRPRRQTTQVEVEFHAASAFLQRNRANTVALGIFHLDLGLGRAGERKK